MHSKKHQEQEIKKLLHTYWNSYLSGDLNTWASFLPDNYRNIGTTQQEILNSKQEAINYTRSVIHQVAGTVEMRNKTTDIFPIQPYVMAHEFADLYIKNGDKRTFYAKLRVTTLLQQTNEGWKILHQHGSIPDMLAQTDESIAFEKVTSENIALRDAVKRRTIELEDKNRELLIEASLEKVRVIALSMKRPADMIGVCRAISEQMQAHGIEAIRNVQTALIDDKSDTYINYQYFTAYGEGTIEEAKYNKHPKVLEMVQKMQQSEDAFFVIDFEGAALEEFRQYRKEDKQFPDPVLDTSSSLHYYFYAIGGGWLGLSTYKPLPDAGLDMFRRFHKAFGLAYRRFLDIEHAEALAREAQIETALERIRARSMAMQSTSELQDIVNLVARQLHKMEMDITGVFIAINNRSDNKEFTFWGSSGVAETYVKRASIPFLDRPIYTVLKELTQNSEGFFVEEYTHEEKIEFFEHMFKFPPYNSSTAEWKKEVLSREGGYTRSVSISHYTTIFVVNHHGRKLSDADNEILRRFGKVFEHSYVRFLDLQKAEAQARETVKQSSLDRVRGQISSMRSTEDLKRITPLIWRELEILDVPFIRCGLIIMDEEAFKVEIYLTTPDGNPLGTMILPLDYNAFIAKTYAHWRKKKIYTEHWTSRQFVAWTKSMLKYGQIKDPGTYQGTARPPESLYLHFVPFGQGILYVGNVAPLADEKLSLIESLAETFSVAYARYEDFAKLRKAKEEVEQALSGLKATQAQLIQSEKMASLGELAAGISHEIQNPLNFVNNFSEVSRELISEVQQELAGGNYKLAKEILDDVENNLDKINHHGKRADAIVKGMLQHSQSSPGIKEPTDINGIADEYFRLAFHGLRAKDKSFNALMETGFDPEIGKINIFAQDISRVILNLITNAFYAVNVKSKQAAPGYKPTVRVQTKRTSHGVELKVTDNGNGIPEKEREKIFNPFFTTKPSGEGTGLGLSMSYDIVTKGHGGKLTMETTEGEGTTFIVYLPD
jgi:signal transduction histidine kinase